MKPTPIEIAHYNQLVGQTIVAIRWSDLEGQALPELVFSRSTASVLCDPEGNGVGFLDIGKIDASELETRRRRLTREVETLAHDISFWTESIASNQQNEKTKARLRNELRELMTDHKQAQEELAALCS